MGFIRWFEGLRRNSPAAYGVAILWAVTALLIRVALLPVIGHRGPYFLFVLAALGSAAVGGFGCGLVTAISGALLAGFVLPPGGFAHLVDPSDPYLVFQYLLFAALLSYVCEVLISARERARTAERRLQESERIYRAIGESIPFGIWICDAQGHNLYTSESLLKLTGLTQQECSEFGWGRALHPDEQKRTVSQWQECVRLEGTWDVELRYRGADGRYHPVLARGVPVRDDQERIVRWAGINLDISRLKEAQTELRRHTEELKRSNRDLEQFAFVASHDMKEPLRTVNIYTELLLRKIGKDRSPELDEFSVYIREGVQRMERLIHDLLEFSRVLDPSVEKKQVNARQLAEDAVKLCQTSVQQAGAEIRIDSLPRVAAGEAHVAQVFQNLISNAIKYRKPDSPPQIRISGEIQGEQVLFKVEDNGIGFDPKYAEKVFALFSRLHGNQYQGTGLGLAICRRIVEQYGGRIWADSRPGEGSTFFFTLPAALP